MISLRPNEGFWIVRGPVDPFETDTLYIQAKVYNASTGSLLATVNLTDRSNGFFSGIWQVTGQIRDQIAIQTTVYTESTYTTKNPNYQRETTHAVIENRPGVFPNYGSGGGGLTER